MRLGLALPHYDTSYGGRPASWDAVAEIARVAERVGFSSVWVSDHLFLDWGKYGGSDEPQGALECFTSMAALAAVTESVRIGSLALCNDLRNPGLVAKMAATVDQLSGGRLDLGMGAGWYEPEYRAAGIPFDPPGDRIRRLGEAAEVIGVLLAEGEVTHKGDHYTLDGAVCRPGPVQEPRPPIWFGGKGDFLIRTAVRHADGWNYSWLGSVDAYRERAAYAERVCVQEGRDPGGFRRSVGAYVVAGSDERDAKRRYERLVERTPEGVLRGKTNPSGVSWEEFKETRIAGTAAEVTDRLGSLAHEGVGEVVVTLGTLPFQLVDLDDVELVGTEIAAALA